ncbi:hypothetical protein ACIQNK_27310 [Streptomyces sp. NPDC091273]|uniref:hypothetical protein n=1 Tax=Streptomyces sp. NPDC091273 TaxID=3365982 RepID=UPI0038184485
MAAAAEACGRAPGAGGLGELRDPPQRPHISASARRGAPGAAAMARSNSWESAGSLGPSVLDHGHGLRPARAPLAAPRLARPR